MLYEVITPVVIVLLANLTYNFFSNSIIHMGWILTPIFLFVSFALLKFLKVHPFIVILSSMIIGALITFI